ncbi:MAG TPA: hypothetical protein VLG46_07640 [Anaerolineae bacterium]|nr:hypothetical protein [Anaerolineae bacterium]
MSVDSTWAERALHHARHIAIRIGPRGAATPEEKRTADYIQRQMQLLGLHDVRVETFSGPIAGWLPITIIFSMAVWSVFACWSLYYLIQGRLSGTNVAQNEQATQAGLPGAVVAAGLCILALVFLFLELTLRDHPLRRLGVRGRSHNVIGRIAPTRTVGQRVVLISQLDTPPATAVFKTPRRTRLFRMVFYLGAASLAGSVILYLIGGLNIWEWAFVFAGIFGMLQSAVIIQSLRADHGEFTPGANFNASGLGTVLALAERVRGTPLQNTEVWIACCGSHIAGSNGLRRLLRQYASDLGNAWLIGFEGVGVGDRVVTINREGWLHRSVHPEIRKLIERTNKAHPDRQIEARATPWNTVVAAATWRGYKSTCLSVYAKHNEIPYAYTQADTVEHLQLSALHVAQEFGWQLLQEIDRGQITGEG